jgi:hypothetical protein
VSRASVSSILFASAVSVQDDEITLQEIGSFTLSTRSSGSLNDGAIL